MPEGLQSEVWCRKTIGWISCDKLWLSCALLQCSHIFVFEGHDCVRTFLFSLCLQKGRAQVFFSHRLKPCLHTASVMYFQPLIANVVKSSDSPDSIIAASYHSEGLRPQSSSQLPQTSNTICTAWTVMWEDQKNLLKSRKQLPIFVRAYSYSWLEPGVRIYLHCS